MAPKPALPTLMYTTQARSLYPVLLHPRPPCQVRFTLLLLGAVDIAPRAVGRSCVLLICDPLGLARTLAVLISSSVLLDRLRNAKTAPACQKGMLNHITAVQTRSCGLERFGPAPGLKIMLGSVGGWVHGKHGRTHAGSQRQNGSGPPQRDA